MPETLPTHYRPTHAPNFTPPTGSGGNRRGFNLFVGTLPAGTQKDDLEILFSPFGNLTDTFMLKQEGIGGRRCGFVSFSTYPSAAFAILVLNGFVVREGEMPICVRFANPVKQRGQDGKEVAGNRRSGQQMTPAMMQPTFAQLFGPSNPLAAMQAGAALPLALAAGLSPVAAAAALGGSPASSPPDGRSSVPRGAPLSPCAPETESDGDSQRSPGEATPCGSVDSLPAALLADTAARRPGDSTPPFSCVQSP